MRGTPKGRTTQDFGTIVRQTEPILISLQLVPHAVAATVGMPVTRHPPCSPGRAVFPHPVPRLHSLPRRVKPCLLWPAGRLAHAAPVRHVRDECPCRAACFRRVLPPVVG